MSEREIKAKLEELAKQYGVTYEYLMSHLENDVDNPL